ncbi:MAG: putative short-chain dehydrogenase [Rhodobacteraceae bacterium HLUCCA12]|nr:MAG: putative short-chain dehydrogenase [Rhodobacteraceae bacterium HLUCCA12]
MSAPVLILGARSDIARACAHRFAQAGHPLVLAARDAATLEADAVDLRLRHGVTVDCVDFDATDSAGHGAFVDALDPLPAVAICAIGAMGDQLESQRDPVAAAAVFRANFEGPALILGELAQRFEARGTGTLVGISSVAGERGRASNYVYGAAKAGFTAFLSGLRNRLARSPVQVTTVLPGFVATRMTEGMDLPARLLAQPDEVANAIFRAVEKRRDVIYVRPIWRLIMAVIRALPEFVFKRTRL